MQFAYMMGGAIVVEYIFSWNGLGRLAIQAIFQRDYPLIQGFILSFSVIVVSVAVLLDVLYSLLDPRIYPELIDMRDHKILTLLIFLCSILIIASFTCALVGSI